MFKRKCPNCSNDLSFWNFVFKGFDKIIEQKPYKCPKCEKILFQDSGRLLILSIILTALPIVVASLIDSFFYKFNFLEYIGLLVGYIISMFYILWLYVIYKIKKLG